MVERVNPDAKEGEPGFTTAFVGGVNLVDGAGNVVDNAAYGSEAAKVLHDYNTNSRGQYLLDTEKPKVYKVGDTYSTKMDASISWDNGKVTITAPDYIANSDWFKDNFTNNDTFKSLVAAYKADPTGETGLTVTDKEGNTKEQTISDLLKQYNDAMGEFSKQYNQVKELKDTVRYDTGVKLSDDDVLIYANEVTRDKNKYDNNTPVYITDDILRYDDLSRFGSWDADSKTISAKDFYEWYNLDDSSDQHKATHIIETQNSLADGIVALQKKARSGELSPEETTEYAKKIALYRTVTSDNPEAGFITSARAFDISMGVSLVDNLFTSAGNALTVLEDVITALDGVNIDLTDVTKSPAKTTLDAISMGLTAAGSTVTGTPFELTAESKQALAEFGMIGILSNHLKTDETGAGVEGVIDIYKQATGKDPESFRSVTNNIHTFLLEQHDELSRLSSAATAGSIVGGMVAEIAKQVLITNPIGKAAGSLFEGTVYGMIGLGDVKEGMNIVAKGLSAKELTNAIKVGSFSTNVVAQGLSDTVLNDADSLHRMFTEGDSTEAQKALAMNTVFNLAGEMTGLATSDGLVALKRTPAGQAVDAWAARGINRIASKKYHIRGKLAEFMNGLKKSADTSGKSVEKFNTAFNYEMETATKNVANAAKLAEEGETVTEATQRLLLQRAQTEFSYGRISRNTARTVLDIQTNPKVAKYYNETIEAAGKVTALEGGPKTARATISQDTSDYIVRSNRIRYYENKSGGDLSKLPKDQQAYVTGLKKKVAEYEATHSPELVTAAKNYSTKLENYWYRYNNYLADEGLLDRTVLKERRDTGFWGKGGKEYMYTQTMVKETDLDTAKWLVEDVSSGKEYRVKTELDDYKYKPGDIDAHYLDPQLTVLSHQMAAAKVIDGRRWANTLIANHTMTKEIDTNGRPVTTQEMKAIRKQAFDTTKQVMSDFTANDDALVYKFAKTYMVKENIPGKLAKKESGVKKLLKLNETRYRNIALDLDADGVAYMRKGFKDIPEYGPVSTRAELNELYYGGSDAQKQAIDSALGAGPISKKLTVKNYNAAIANTDLSNRLACTYISENAKIMESARFKNFATKIRTQELTARQQTVLKKYYKDIRDLQKQAKLVEMGEDEFTQVIDGFTEDLVAETSARIQKNAFLKEAIGKYTGAGVSKKQAVRYLALDNIHKTLKDNSLTKLLDKNLNNITTSGNLTTKQKQRFVRAIKGALKDNVTGELAKSADVLQKNGAKALIDTDALFQEISDCMKDFAENTVKAPNVVRVMDDEGAFHLYEVSPTTAYLINNRPDFSNIKSNKVVQFFNQTNRLFRTFTTGYSLSSFTNQWMRDPLNAYVMGGFVKSLDANAEEIGRLFGPSIAESMKKELGEAGWKEVVAKAGGDEAEAIGSLIKEEATKLYEGASPETKFFREMATARRETLYGNYEQPVGKMEKAMRAIEEHSLGNFRETYLRKANFAQAYDNALKSGMTPIEARAWAEVIADNATTDFSRSFAWGNNIVNSVPYLGAAINGQASFWRLLELDPTGVAGRFILGLVIPMVALTTSSTANEENRRVYMKIPEYVKEDNLVFVADGQAFKVPIPQELSAFLAPFRQMVEKANNANDETWQELVLNDILSVPAIDFSGLADLDDPLGRDADFFSRLSNEAETLISQMSPVTLKTAYMAVTGRDPYTHSNIDTSYTYIDSEGNLQIMDNSDSSLARWFSATAKNVGIDLSASSAEAILGQLLGQAALDLDGVLTGLFSGNPVRSLEVVGKRATKPFTATAYDQTESAWKQAVKALQAEKQQLLADPELAKINNAIGATSDPTALKNLRAQYREKTQAYRQKVLETVQAYNKAYGADYDWKKFGSTISLLSFYNNTQDLNTASAKEHASELYYDAQNLAKQTMIDMGFTSPTDWSIFGYIHTDANGNVEARTTTPVQILNMEGVFYQSRDEATAQIRNTISNVVDANGKTLKDKYNEMTKKETELYAKKDYDSLENLYKKWDIEFMAAIYPTLASSDLADKYGDSILDNNEVIDLLDNYIRVPSSYMGKGKYISSSTGLNKNRGYAKSYIQKIFNQMEGTE